MTPSHAHMQACYEQAEQLKAEKERTRAELNRTKSGDSLTRYDPPLDLALVFEVANSTVAGSLVGYEFTDEEGNKLLVGHVNEGGSLSDGSPRTTGLVVAGRKVWFP